MADAYVEPKKKFQGFVFKVLKATVKAVIFYLFYIILWGFMSPVSEFIPGLQLMVEAFVIIYVFLMVIGDLTAGTIYQYFFSGAKALFVIAYLILSLGGGIFGFTFENVNLTIDLRIFLAIVTLLSLLGFTKSVLQAVNYMSEKAEYARI